MVAATQGERRALLTAAAVRCAASRGLEEEEEERGKREEAPKKAMEKMSGVTQGRAKSAGRERERMCDRVVGKDGGRETLGMSGRGGRERQ